MIDEQALQQKAQSLLETFHARRMAKLNTITLGKILKKNPYLYRAIGVGSASDYVKAALDAFISSSDETIFGNEFFEPLAKWAAIEAHRGRPGHTVQVGGGAGMDIAIESETEYKAIAVKSGTNIFNAQSGRQQDTEYDALAARIRKERKVFIPIIGYGYGRKKQREEHPGTIKLAGQAFWKEITGEEDFYLRIIVAFGDRPGELSQEFERAYAQTRNRLEREFLNQYVDAEGRIVWSQVVAYSSSNAPLRRARR